MLALRSIIAVVFLCLSADARPGASPVGRLETLPPARGYWYTLISPENERLLEELAASDPGAIEQLLASDDPREIGAGIFALSAQGQVRRLLELDALLDDARPTIPRPEPVSLGYAAREQTVRTLLRMAIGEWTGLAGPGFGPESVRDLRERFPDPDQLVTPWLTRLRLATDDPAARAVVVDQIEALPEPLRWIVAAKAWNDGQKLDEREARRILEGLSAPMKRAIADRSAPLNGDPVLSIQSDQVAVFDVGQALLDASTRGRLQEYFDQKRSEPTLPDVLPRESPESDAASGSPRP